MNKPMRRRYRRTAFAITLKQSAPMVLTMMLMAALSLVGYSFMKLMPDMSVYVYAVAGYSACILVGNAISGIMRGFNEAASVLVANAYGVRDAIRVWEITKHALAIGLVLSTLLAIGAASAAIPLVQFFSGSEESARLAQGSMILLMLAQPTRVPACVLALLARGTGEVKYNSMFATTATILSVVSGFLLVQVYGIFGLALSIVIGGVFESAAWLAVLAKKKLFIQRIVGAKFRKDCFFEILKLGYPISAKLSIARFGTASVVAALSMLGPVFVAAYQISKDIVRFGTSAGEAIRVTTSSLIGKRDSVCNARMVKAYARSSVLAALSVAAIVCTVIIIFQNYIFSFITSDGEIFALMAKLLPVYLLTIVLSSLGDSLAGALQGMKRMALVSSTSISATVIFLFVMPYVMLYMTGSYLGILSVFVGYHIFCDVIWAMAVRREMVSRDRAYANKGGIPIIDGKL